MGCSSTRSSQFSKSSKFPKSSKPSKPSKSSKPSKPSKPSTPSEPSKSSKSSKKDRLREAFESPVDIMGAVHNETIDKTPPPCKEAPPPVNECDGAYRIRAAPLENENSTKNLDANNK